MSTSHHGRYWIRPRPLTGASWAGRRIGILGGSFNPAHAGHRHVSQWMLRRLNLDQVWWLVSPQNPLKQARGMATLDARLDAARAMAQDPRILVTDLETQLGTRYTVDTLAALRRRYPRTRFVWIMGADNLLQIPRWRGWAQIMGRVPVAVFPRRPYSLKALVGKAARRYLRNRVPPRDAGGLPARPAPAWTFLDGPLHPASATEIRRKGWWGGR
ncbi:nicotinate-nucleotide adenylyltransferase [Azospirillum sp. B4]|uniref:nicotinate-nucleotide adenylyltransferase n=1 Tax=Azospirillum sp. B4 TaxID=95605 RepID=UPI000349AFAE|nr:nicotinate-nucleotide adenylyltransferase [Azospirillum sp. B4]